MNNHKRWVSEVFDRTAPEYGKKSSSFFSNFGKRLVEQVEILPGQHVLDIATGRGAVLFPLAEAVGPTGKVVGIDISQKMITETSKEVLKKDLSWAELRCMDAESLDFPDSSFDFVFCGFGLFFLPSIPTALSEFKRVLKPGGKVVVSTWGEDSELDTWVNEETKKVCETNSLIATPLWSERELFNFLKDACFNNIQISEETMHFFHRTTEEWWDSLWSHATRAQFEQLIPDQITNLRKKAVLKGNNLNKGQGIPEELQVLYGISQKS
ncbi:MAG: class I SAM-dependent methyltransferase [Parachlamydiaceae bacterium]|nr:class I SAM-dependent methyltransferase [Parachlamydiaceae bacterium]